MIPNNIFGFFCLFLLKYRITEGEMNTSKQTDCLFENDPYMSQDQLHYFQAKLINWRKELSRGLHRSANQSLDSENSADWIDAASQQTQAEITRVNQQHSIRLVREIDDALNRIASGTYGFCIVTGEEIGIKRLSALPIAKYSVVTQEQMEQRQRVYV
jgi:DnaK suppressor protein